MARIEPTTIRDAVIKTLKASEFYTKLCETYPETKVYDNEISQDLVDGCFFVKSINPSRSHYFGKIYSRTELIDVRYFLPNIPEKEDLILNLIEDLTDLLEYIEIDGELYRGRNMESKVIDDILHVYVTYPMRVMKVEPPEEPMEELETMIEMESE